MRITVLGSGGWGSAIAMLLDENGHEVHLWSAFDREAEALRRTRQNPLLEGVTIPESVTITSDISCVSQAELVVLAVPSFAVRETVGKIVDIIPAGVGIVIVSKGIERESMKNFSQVAQEVIGNEVPIAALSGPSHAEEVARGVPTACVAASDDSDFAHLLQDVFMSERFRVYTSSDVVGVELGGALKNIIALCAGVCDGMGLGDNTVAMLMTRGLSEMASLGVALGGKRETFAGLAGVGDLIVTCTSRHSRNRRAGQYLGQGFNVEESMEKVGAVVEGYYAAAATRKLALEAGIEMPISEQTYKVLYEGKDARQVVRELMTRDRKAEHEDMTWMQKKTGTS